MNIVKLSKISFAFSTILFVLSLGFLVAFGLKPGIEFTGGSLIEFSFTQERPVQEEVQAALAPMNLETVVLQPTGDNGYILKTQFVTEAQHQEILSRLKATFTEGDNNLPVATLNEEGALVIDDTNVQKIVEQRVETIGPAISSELTTRSIQAGIVVIVAIILFIAYAFRRVSQPVSSWKYGITAIIALIHDVTITMGVFALLGHFAGVEIDIPFVVALLTILGYSVNDTIVVFDRIRERLMKRGRATFAETVNRGVNETVSRSINTSITTLLVLVALFLFGGVTIKYFALALVVGIILGTYSSIFLASPLLIVWQKLGNK